MQPNNIALRAEQGVPVTIIAMHVYSVYAQKELIQEH